MAKTARSNEHLVTLARENYMRLSSYCRILERDGYWEEPGRIMKKTTADVLDLYVQSLLVHAAASTKRLRVPQRRFILSIPDDNVLEISQDTKVPEDVVQAAERFIMLPPILLQLCSVYDEEKKDNFTEYFLDGLINIVLCMARLDESQGLEIGQYIKDYFERIQVFMNQSAEAKCNSKEYIERKITSEEIGNGVNWLHPISSAMIKREKQSAARKKRASMKNVANGGATVVEHQSAVVEVTQGGAAKKTEPQADTVENGAESVQMGEGKVQAVEETGLEKAESAQIEVEKAKPAQMEMEETESVQIEMEKTESAQIEMEETESVQIEMQKTESAQIKMEKAKPAQMEIEKAEPAQMEIEKAKPARMEIEKAEPALDEGARRKQEENLQEEAKEQFLQVKKRIKDRELQQEKERQARIDEILDKLNNLVGLKEVKTEINSLINVIKVRKMREIMKMPAMDMSYHMVFTGNPGTGKTTVARLVAKIYQELGILSKGTLIETDRSGLVAGYVGQTALKVKEVVESAIGGVLFIDEAYALSNQGNSNDFGGEVLDTLVKMMEDHRDDLVVIVAGYPKEMDAFLKANTGLISRFNRFISFEDYSVDELVEILQVMAKDAGLILKEEALTLVRSQLEAKTPEEMERFGNARGIRNMFEKIVVNQANRIVLCEEPTEEILRTILPEDI